MDAKRQRYGIHATDVRQFKSCRQAWDFSSPLRRNLQPNIPDRNLWVGDGVHKALANYYNPITFGGDKDAEVAAATYAAWRFDAVQRLDQYEISEEKRQEMDEAMSLGSAILEHYLEWAPKHDHFEVIDTEVKLEIPLPFFPGKYVYFEGQTDAYVRDINTGEYFFVEHKTAAQFPDSDQLLLDEQCIAYLWASRAAEAAYEHPPVGTLYNFIRKKAPTLPRLLLNGRLSEAKSIDTTFETYVDAIRSVGQDPRDYQEMLLYLWTKPNDFFQRVTIKRSDQALIVFGNGLMDIIVEMLSPSVLIYPAPDWFKCRRCQFRDPCTAIQEGLDPAILLDTNYVKRELKWPTTEEEVG